MYQSAYRYPKKKHTSRVAKLLASIVGIAILVGGIRYLSSLGSKLEQTQTVVSTWSTIQSDWYFGKDVSLAGTLSGSSEPLSYSHTLITTGEETIRLNSSSIDLNNYNGFVYIKWVVSKSDGKEFTIDVKAIGNTEWDLQATSFVPSTDTKFFSKIGLKIDVSTSNGISYTAKDNTIIFSSETLSGSVEVAWFKCESGFPEKDCLAMSKKYTESTFVNRGGLTIWKEANWSGWFAWNNAGAGYKMSASSDALLYKVSSVLMPINEAYIKTLVPEITKLCTPGADMTNPTITKESLDAWLVKTAACTARVTIDDINGEKVTILSKEDISNVKSGSVVPTDNTTTTTTTTPNTTWAVNTSPAPKLTASGHDFTSTRWNYIIHFPSASISYNGINVSENLGVKGLNCYVSIGVKSYADRENDSVGPAVEIYECTSKLSSSSISVPWTIMKTSADGTKLFFIKTLNSNWEPFANGINIQ